MPADLVNGHSRRDLGVTLMKGDPARIDVAHHLADMVGGERLAKVGEAHARPRHVGHLGGLQVESRVRKSPERAGMIVVHVRYDQLLDHFGGNAEQRQGGRRRLLHRPAALPAFRLVEPGVDDDGPRRVADDPDEIVHRLQAIVVVGEDVILMPLALDELGVFDCQDLVGFGAHSRFSPKRQTSEQLIRPLHRGRAAHHGEDGVSPRRQLLGIRIEHDPLRTGERQEAAAAGAADQRQPGFAGKLHAPGGEAGAGDQDRDLIITVLITISEVSRPVV